MLEHPMTRARRALATSLALIVAAATVILQLRPAVPPAAAGTSTASACIPGVERVGENEGIGGVAGRALDAVPDFCTKISRVERPDELLRIGEALDARFGTSTPWALLKANATKAAIARTVRPVPGGGASWEPVGTTPLFANDPNYSVYGEGFGEVAGRISDFSYDEATGRLWAAVASGGVYESRDLGATWRSIGDGLPTQQVGSVAYTPAGGGTLIALSGDNAFGGYTYAGTGGYYTTNGGRTWKRAKGLPAGAMAFKLAVDPTNPREIYAATGFGLFRSTNAGRSFVNTRLPTGACAGNSLKEGCFLANIVTDVVVQVPDELGSPGGIVLAVVGWRAGAYENADGTVQSPENGLYRSETGAPGTFVNLNEDGIGFAPQGNIGRVELGAATGVDQNHGYVYALVQDSVLFVTGRLEGLDVEPMSDPVGLVDLTATATYLKGVYVSADFGESWTLMADRKQFQSPHTGSSLAQLQALGVGPGIQSWYNMWIRPDPTRQINGIPTRIVLGLEEIWQNTLTLAPAAGPTDFRVIGPYTANTGACIVILLMPACGAAQSQKPDEAAYTTHPDQHAGIWIPDPDGGVTLIAGHDGGVNTQHVPAFGELTTGGFGVGSQDGFHTLLPYGVDVANDGIIYAGLQDNGQIRIEKDGRQTMVFGGDGIFTVVNPKNSNEVWEETPGAGVRVSTDGGLTWKDALPSTDNASFYAPLVMDPLDPNHLITGGRQVMENTHGPAIGYTIDELLIAPPEHDWEEVFELGSRLHPGEAPPDPLEPGDTQNMMSSATVRGKNVYVGYCGGCDPVRDHDTFASGVATNVTGAWRIAPARGLPDRLITSLTIDPKNPFRVVATLGSSSYRPYAPPGALGPDGVDKNGGPIWMSENGGNSFFDVSGNLPRIGGTWSVLRRNQLIVGTTVGVFAATSPLSGARPGRGLTFAVLGKGLPAAPVFSMSLKKNDPNTLVVASLGRGVYRYRFR